MLAGAHAVTPISRNVQHSLALATMAVATQLHLCTYAACPICLTFHRPSSCTARPIPARWVWSGPTACSHHVGQQHITGTHPSGCHPNSPWAM